MCLRCHREQCRQCNQQRRVANTDQSCVEEAERNQQAWADDESSHVLGAEQKKHCNLSAQKTRTPKKRSSYSHELSPTSQCFSVIVSSVRSNRSTCTAKWTMLQRYAGIKVWRYKALMETTQSSSSNSQTINLNKRTKYVITCGMQAICPIRQV